MPYTSEIEKLEKRWAENPKGRNFAPLADAYRKAGELDRALELCTAGLQLHPDYVSAHIVFGRCLIDQKNDAGAAEVFRKVLALDPENVLALKILADLAERGGRFDEVVVWLGRLLSADPMNGDAAEGLARAKAKAAPPPPPAPPARQSQPPSPPAAQRDLVVEHAAEQPVTPVLGVKGAPAEIETFDGTLDFDAVAHDAARADGLEVQEEVELKPQDLVVEGLAHTQYESGMFGTPPAAAESDDGPKIDLPLIMPEDMVELPPVPALLTPGPVGGRTSAPAAPPPPPAAVASSDDDGAADTAALSRAEPVLTETMAELYLRQGHQEDALRVYQALLAKQPADARLRGRVDEITGRGKREGGHGTGETVQVFLKRILAGRPGVWAPDSDVQAPEPTAPVAGSPLDAAFGVMHPAEPAPPSAASPRTPGEVTRPAGDSISLDQVFGDEGSGHPAQPAEAAPRPPAPTPQQPGGFSFDQFFSAPEGAGAGAGAGGGEASGGGGAAGTAPQRSAEGGATSPSPARPSGGRALPPLEDEGDLDQFQAWLRGLKS